MKSNPNNKGNSVSELNFAKIGTGTYQVLIPTVRELGWILTRKIGKGTYAEIAGSKKGSRENIVVEEFSDPDSRKKWDMMSAMECIEAAHRIISSCISNRGKKIAPLKQAKKTIHVRRRHPYDGTPLAGKPIGPTLTVDKITDYKPAEGPVEKACVYHLTDGTSEFMWNLKVVKEKVR